LAAKVSAARQPSSNQPSAKISSIKPPVTGRGMSRPDSSLKLTMPERDSLFRDESAAIQAVKSRSTVTPPEIEGMPLIIFTYRHFLRGHGRTRNMILRIAIFRNEINGLEDPRGGVKVVSDFTSDKCR